LAWRDAEAPDTSALLTCIPLRFGSAYRENALVGGARWRAFIAHSGSVPGYTAFLLGNRDRKLGFAIMTNGNRAHPHLFKLADRAIDLLKKYSNTEKRIAAQQK